MLQAGVIIIKTRITHLSKWIWTWAIVTTDQKDVYWNLFCIIRREIPNKYFTYAKGIKKAGVHAHTHTPTFFITRVR